MKRIFWPIVVMALFALRLTAQTSLEFFTNQANTLLEQQFGFGVTNIPIYSTAAPSNAYSSSWHYWLQAAANAYDATTPATNSPSVFRPLFGWSSNTLYIVGYTNVTSDFYAQIAAGFKQIDDPTITTNDNVWGIPWVVGMKGSPPAFNEYSYVTDVMAQRQLFFQRAISGGQIDTNRPPIFTNQIFILSVSNVFGLEAWNYSPSNFPDPVTIVLSNQVSVFLTNNYNWGTNYEFTVSTNLIIDSWPGTDSPSNASFIVPMFTNVVPMLPSYWSDSTEQFVLLNPTNYNVEESILPSDLRQMGWPEHNWTLSISNDLMYVLIDNRTSLILDFLNLGGVENLIPISEALENQPGFGGIGEDNLTIYWETNDATDLSNSPMSAGLTNQILEAEARDPTWALNLVGLGNSPAPILACPFNLGSSLVLESSWQTIKPILHYTAGDLSVGPELSDSESLEFFLLDDVPSIESLISNSICTLGKPNRYLHAVASADLNLGLQNTTCEISFSGLNDLPYAIWASTNMIDWVRAGVASELNSQPPEDYLSMPFQFTDSITNSAARFYQLRVP
jgi:hypothetical protein